MIINGIIRYIQRYNHKKYWKMRKYLADNKKCNMLKALWFLYRIKRMDAFNNASLGTHIGECAYFATTPALPHGIRGIFVSHRAIIGKNAVIFHHVTIGEGRDGAPRIGDDCYIGAGAKIVGNVKIGNNVRIGAGCIVATDIPDNCTVVMEKPRIILRKDS